MPSVNYSHFYDFEPFAFGRRIEENYTIAFNRLGRSGLLSYWDDDRSGAYERAQHMTQTIIERRSKHQEILFELYTHIKKWKSDTTHWSSIIKMLSHPSYLRIIELAQYFHAHEVVKALLQELATEPDHWFTALTAITGEDPTQPEHDFDEAVNAWLVWGQKKEII